MPRILTALAFTAMIALALALAPAAFAADIVEEWGQAKAPDAPKLADVTVKTATTAFLILDIEEATCNDKDRPRCIAAVPAMANFLAKARGVKMLVAYSNTSRGTRDTIVNVLKPIADEHLVKASVDKFYGTDLEQYLKGKNIDTLIVCATTAFGAGLHTAQGASVRGLKVIYPVDCVPGSSQYEEQAAAFTVANGPGTRANATLTRLAMIKIE